MSTLRASRIYELIGSVETGPRCCSECTHDDGEDVVFTDCLGAAFVIASFDGRALKDP